MLIIVSCTFRDRIQCNLESTFTNMHLRSPSVKFCPPGVEKYCRPLPNRAKPEASELDIAKINLNWHARSPVNTMGLTRSTKPITMLIANVKSTPARTATNMSAGFCRKRQYAMQYSTKPLPTLTRSRRWWWHRTTRLCRLPRSRQEPRRSQTWPGRTRWTGCFHSLSNTVSWSWDFKRLYQRCSIDPLAGDLVSWKMIATPCNRLKIISMQYWLRNTRI